MRFKRYQNGGTTQSGAVVFIRNCVEWLIRVVDGDNTFYPAHDKEWVKLIEDHTDSIVSELKEVMKTGVPAWQKLSDDPQVQQGDSWKTFVLYAYGQPVISNHHKCPETIKALSHIPEMKTAWFSILEPQTSLPPHEGPYNGMLRYHLGLVIPSEDAEACGIRVGNDTRTWKEGSSLLFDDTHDHEAWNRTNEKRVVLFVDMIRPLPIPFSWLNKLVISVAGNSPFIKQIIERAEAN